MFKGFSYLPYNYVYIALFPKKYNIKNLKTEKN